MDKFISVCVVPIAVLICFGPGLIFWVLEELKGSGDEPGGKK